MNDPLQLIMKEIEQALCDFQTTSMERVVTILSSATRVFVAGEGRSGLMAKAFAMRLMHLGADVYVVGETITPSIQNGDVLIAVSGSGVTKSTVWMAEKARQLGCPVMAFTTDVASPLAQNASCIVYVPAATKYRRDHEKASIQPLSSLFDQCIHIILDAICLQYAEVKQVEHKQAFSQHSNLD
ncbi:6-phospho 3-hexuloisomerase [Anoxybacillus sp. B7M1]|jgi:6-phospho-3-hexuloisomerase|uniref:6-phospho-3-hexuloisomerase n=1 Tax=unclassified Anoxybacillus TaxID=2639704 RepID=UPI00069876FD|nr:MULTISPECIES: 6-phospho-3-hexuloisomerase [unclassified Anoxybacillus]ANB56715.1 6-phospho 3-hexuloisomerase [Anoxybacillus sp. B2M1]ANB63465.1 6-phospho 3-hexuloisomerase [Anoxybacillus sp. B7M1]